MRRLNWWKAACGVCVLSAATAIALRAQTFTSLLSFDGTDGAVPDAGLVQTTAGTLYGTTIIGGDNGFGTIFKITPTGTLTTLYSFCSQAECKDGRSPDAGLVQASNGNLYGTTNSGGIEGLCKGGCGTVFKISPGGALTTLYSFCSQSGCADGENPYAGLVPAIDGNLYGTTAYGGANDSCFDGACGTVFKINPSGTLTTLYSFCSQSGCADGANPLGALIQASDGDFYGTTYAGGANSYGTVFKITPNGTLTTLYSFCSQGGFACTDGSEPEAGLVQGSDGNFYGTTIAGGFSSVGTVFEITPGGALTTLYSFCSQSSCSDGGSPFATLIQGTDGNFYGTTYIGGAAGSCTDGGGCGTVFKITSSGALSTLYAFCSKKPCRNGALPSAGLAQDTNGRLYGTTQGGGANGEGTLFSLSVGLGPFVETQPTSGKIGRPIKILGTNLTGATSVTFNGTAATFTVVSPSLITTTVPAGATTGAVQVVTPGGTLSSNVPFRVIQ